MREINLIYGKGLDKIESGDKKSPSNRDSVVGDGGRGLTKGVSRWDGSEDD